MKLSLSEIFKKQDLTDTLDNIIQELTREQRDRVYSCNENGLRNLLTLRKMLQKDPIPPHLQEYFNVTKAIKQLKKQSNLKKRHAVYIRLVQLVYS